MKRYIRSDTTDLHDENWDSKFDIAQNPNTSSRVLARLATDPDNYVRYTVAVNPNTPVDILRKFVEQNDLFAMAGVANNLNTPIDLLRTLAHSDYEPVRIAVAENPNVPLDCLYILSEDLAADWEIVHAVAANDKTTPDILRNIYNKFEPFDEPVFRWPRWKRETYGIIRKKLNL